MHRIGRVPMEDGTGDNQPPDQESVPIPRHPLLITHGPGDGYSLP